jgi:putative endonuclease
MRTFFVYVLSNASRTLYVDITNDLERRIHEHRARKADGFTRRYNITLLMHAEEFAQVGDVIAREKELKGWSRAKKIALIEEGNPPWDDLSTGW